jgi:tetratricopeptide (TPR) repeat protein
VFQKKGQLDEAEEMLRRALAIDEAAHGPDHPSTGTTVNKLAGVLKDKGQLDEAEAMCRHALAIAEAVYGKDHRNTIYMHGTFESLLMLQGVNEGDGQKAAEGRAAVEETLRLLKAPPHSLPEGHRWVVRLSGFLA